MDTWGVDACRNIQKVQAGGPFQNPLSHWSCGDYNKLNTTAKIPASPPQQKGIAKGNSPNINTIDQIEATKLTQVIFSFFL